MAGTTVKEPSVNDIQQIRDSRLKDEEDLEGILQANAFAIFIKLLTLSDNPGAPTWP